MPRFLLLLLLALIISPARAETIAATHSDIRWSSYVAYSCGGMGTPTCTLSAAKAADCTGFGGPTWYPAPGGTTRHISDNAWAHDGFCTNGGSPVARTVDGTAFLGCPTSGGWTLSGSNCTRPDCPQGQDRNESGVCGPPPCQSGESISFSIFSGYSVGANAVVGAGANPYTNGANRCNGTCTFNVTSITNCPAQVGTVDNPKPITCHGTGVLTGATCSVDESVGSTAPLIPNHRPKCLAGEGVLTTSSGTVACVPSGTPSSAPVVRTTSQTQQFPDGSTRTTETTYTKDPVTQVQDSQQQITNTPATGGGAGMAGPVGTTSNSGSATPSSGDGKESSDFCRLNSQLQICKGDMNKEETQKQVLEALKPTEPADKSALDAAIADKAAEDAHKAKFEDIGALGQSDENGWFAWAMIPEVPSGSCAPMTGQFMGRTIQFDWCDELEKVRSIAGYAFYIVTAFAMFSIFTGAFGRKT